MYDQNLERQLGAYSRRASRRSGKKTAAEILGYTAAAGGMAFAGGDAMAAIHHFNTQLRASEHSASHSHFGAGIAAWDINNNGQVDAVIFAYGSTDFRVHWGLLGNANSFGFGSGRAYFASSAAQLPYIANLPVSNTVGPAIAFSSSSGRALAFEQNGAVQGPFANTTGYVGFKFADASTPGFLYGWAKVRVDFTPDSVTTTVFEWAYEDSGAPIHVPDRSSGSVPEPATPLLSLIALGAMGVREYRRRRDAGLARLAESAGQPQFPA